MQAQNETPPQTALPPPAGLVELTPEQWAMWRQHPVTRVFHQFLRDYQQTVQQAVLGQWAKGASLADEREARGRWLAAGEMVELSLDAVKKAYGVGE